MSDQIKEPEMKDENESTQDINNIAKKIDDLECSKKIGEYILFDEIGMGTFSKVVRGFHLITQQTVAVKILDKDKIEDEIDIERIIREIEILKNIHHPNIAQMYETYSTVHNFYIMLEYAPGGDLFDYITSHNYLSEKESCYFFRQIISVLEYLMEMGISHRDIKPENVLLNEDHTEIKLIDFGLSNYCLQNELLHSSCGSPCYASPEMLSGESYSGNTTDLWSAGIILYSMLVGALPFDDQEINKLYEQIKIGKFYIPSTLSLEAIDLLKKILEVDPKKRINIEGVKNHSWFKLEENPMYKGINISIEHFPCDTKVVNYVIKNYFKDKEDISSSILVKMIHLHECNKYTATYYLVKNNILKIAEKFKIRKEKKIDKNNQDNKQSIEKENKEECNKDINKLNKENNNQNHEDNEINSNAKELLNEKNEEIKNEPNDNNNKKNDNKLILATKLEDDLKLKNETEENNKYFFDNDKTHKEENTHNKNISNNTNQKMSVKNTLNENSKSRSKQKNNSKIKINEKEIKKSNEKNTKIVRTEKYNIPTLNIEKYNEIKFDQKCITERPLSNYKKNHNQTHINNNNKNIDINKNTKIVSDSKNININHIFVKNISKNLKRNKTNSHESKNNNLNKMNTMVNKDGQNKNEILRINTLGNNKNSFNKIKITSKSNKNYKYEKLHTENNILSTNGVTKDNNNKNDNDYNYNKNYQLTNNNNKFNEINLFKNKINFRNSNKIHNKYRTKNNINEKKNSNTYINKNLISLDNNVTNIGYTINLNIQNNNIFNNQDNNYNIKPNKKNNKKKRLNIIPNYNKPTNIYNTFNNNISKNKSHLRNYKTALKNLFTDLKMVNKLNNNDFLMPKIINISRNKKSSFCKDNNSATITNFTNKNKSINNKNIKKNSKQLITNNSNHHSGSHDENKNNFSISPKFIGKIQNVKDKKIYFINNNILKIDYLEKKNKKNKIILTSKIGNNNNESSRNNAQRNYFASTFQTEVNMRHNSSNRDNDNLSAVFNNKKNKNQKINYNNYKYAFNLKLKDKSKNNNNNSEQNNAFNNSNNFYSKSKNNIANKKIKDF